MIRERNIWRLESYIYNISTTVNEKARLGSDCHKPSTWHKIEEERKSARESVSSAVNRFFFLFLLLLVLVLTFLFSCFEHPGIGRIYCCLSILIILPDVITHIWTCLRPQISQLGQLSPRSKKMEPSLQAVSRMCWDKKRKSHAAPLVGLSCPNLLTSIFPFVYFTSNYFKVRVVISVHSFGERQIMLSDSESII